MAAVRDGIDQLDRALPFSWSGRVVVYSVEDPRVLALVHATCPGERSTTSGR